MQEQVFVKNRAASRALIRAAAQFKVELNKLSIDFDDHDALSLFNVLRQGESVSFKIYVVGYFSAEGYEPVEKDAAPNTKQQAQVDNLTRFFDLLNRHSINTTLQYSADFIQNGKVIAPSSQDISIRWSWFALGAEYNVYGDSEKADFTLCLAPPGIKALEKASNFTFRQRPLARRGNN